MTMNLITKRYKPSQPGFGLIEIMIALVLGIIIMLGVTQIATNNSNTRYELERAGRQMENAAFALGEIEKDLTNAAFWGERGAVTAGVFPPVCPDNITELEEQAMGFPVQGGQGEFDCVVVDPLPPKTKITPKAGTDYLAVRRASSCALDEPDCDLADTNFHLQVHSCFDIDSSDKAGDFEISDNVTDLVYTMRNCATAAPIYRFLNHIYYINDDDQLMRAELVGGAYEEAVLVDGVEWMSIEYGMDRDGDGQLDDDVNAITPDPRFDLATNTPDAFPESEWADVVMVRISLVVRSTEPSGGFGDDKVYTIGTNEDGSPITYCVSQTPPLCTVEFPAIYKTHRRQVYSRTVGLRNVAGRREVQ